MREREERRRRKREKREREQWREMREGEKAIEGEERGREHSGGREQRSSTG